MPSARTPRRERRSEEVGERTPDPQFYMPTVDVEGRGVRAGGYNLRRRAARPGDSQGSPRRRGCARGVYDEDAGEGKRAAGERVAASIPNAALDVL